MAEITTAAVKQLREQTGAGIMDCKRALQESNGDMAKASEVLRMQGLARAEKKSARSASQGLIESYIHGGRIGVLLEVNCETDFVARTPEFKELVHDIAMQIAAQKPLYISEADVPEGTELNADEQPILMNQPFIKNSSLTIGQLVTDSVAKIGENIVVRRFARFELGE